MRDVSAPAGLAAVRAFRGSDSMPKRSVELRQQAKAKHDAVSEIIRLVGEDRDFSKKDVLEKLGATDSADAVKKFTAWTDEAHRLFTDAQNEEMKERIAEHQDRDADLQRARPPGGGHPPEPEGEKSFGQLFVESKAYTEGWRQHRQRNVVAEVGVPLKTLMTTTAGWAPRPPRIDRVIDLATRPIQVLDLIPMDPTANASIIYMEETTRTISAAEAAEGGTYAESVEVFTERTSAVRKIADSIPVTDEQLDDVDQVRALLDNRLRFNLRQRLDGQVLTGNGTAPNLLGILNASGLQTQARSTDPHFDAAFKALTKVRFTGRAEPNAIVVHPTDWQTFRLMRTADGIYILGDPSQPGPMQLFGLPVTLSDALTLGTALTGAFTPYCQLWERRGVEVQVGWVSTQFVEGKQTLRADMRVAFVVYRGAAFCTITGL